MALGLPPLARAENQQIWTTQFGREVRIVDMTDDHLRNTIFYLNKHYGASMVSGRVPLLPATEWGQQFLTRTPQDICALYDVMRREADRRHLHWI